MKKYDTVHLKIFSFRRAISKPSPKFFSYPNHRLSSPYLSGSLPRSLISFIRIPIFKMQKALHHLILAESRGIIKCLLSSTGAF